MRWSWEPAEESPRLPHPIETSLAWGEWEKYCCTERGGHWWWLYWGREDDCLYLVCSACPAGVDDLYPDGRDLIAADLIVFGQRVLVSCGDVTTELPGFAIPVQARTWTSHFFVPGVADEWDVGIEVTAA
jgi:hypothetical protein